MKFLAPAEKLCIRTPRLFFFSSIQAFNTELNVKEGVGWNYESPSTVRSKAEMLKILNETDSPELRTIQTKPSYNFGLSKATNIFSNENRQILKNSSPVIIDKEGLDLLNDLKVMADKAKNSEKINENEDSSTTILTESPAPTTGKYQRLARSLFS